MKPIRVALSGSGFKTPAHVGALLAIRDAGFEVVEMAATSGGSMVAALYACGMPLDEMKVLSMTKNWSNLLRFNPWSLVSKLGYCSGKTLLDWMAENTNGKRFSDLKMDLTVMASDVSKELPFKFSRQETPDVPVAVAVRASTSIPLVYAPMKVHGAMCVDGGCVNNIPVDQLVIDKIPRIGIQLVSKCSPLTDGRHSIFSLAPRIVDMMMSANENTHVDLAESSGARVAFVETGYVSGLNSNMPTEMRHRLMQDGYDATMRVLQSIGSAPEIRASA
jgi:NTE family protein